MLNYYSTAAKQLKEVADRVCKVRHERHVVNPVCWHCNKSLYYDKVNRRYTYVEAKIDGYVRKLHHSCSGGETFNSNGLTIDVRDFDDYNITVHMTEYENVVFNGTRTVRTVED